MRRLLRLATLFLALGGAASCAAILGFERLSEEGGLVLDGGQDATDDQAIPSEASTNDGGACGEIGIVAEPPDAAPGVVAPVLVALKLLDLGGTGSVPGFNLDRVCSVDLASSSCTTRVLEPTFDRHAKDKSATGIDNAGSSFIESISGFSTLLTAAGINAGVAAGRHGAVIRITGWNGRPDDDDVHVDVFPAIGLLPRADPDAGFDVNDRWVLDARFEAAPLSSTHGWVSGGTLAARLEVLELPIAIDGDPKPFELRLHDVILQGTLTTTNGLIALTAGTLAGRWKTAELLAAIRTVYVKNSGGLEDTVLCEPVAAAELLYGGMKKEACDARDIRGGSSDDNQRLPCDALSTAMRVDTYSVVNLGAFDASAPVAPRCEDAAVPPGDDCTPN